MRQVRNGAAGSGDAGTAHTRVRTRACSGVYTRAPPVGAQPGRSAMAANDSDSASSATPLERNILRHHELILVLDFGSQYSHLIARRLREVGVYCELYPFDVSAEDVRATAPKGIILSGGPSSVYEEGAPHVDAGVFELGIPMLGICYGLQEMAHRLGGRVAGDDKKEFGRAELRLRAALRETAPALSVLFRAVPDTLNVWMSHGDKITQLPRGFVDLAVTDNCEHAVVAYDAGAAGAAGAAEAANGEAGAVDGGSTPLPRMFGLQFHPEVTHSDHGATLLGNFCKSVCGCKCDWSMEAFVDEATETIREQVGEGGVVIGAVSGGVDSTVAAVLMAKAIGTRFHALLVENGLLRKGEAAEVMHRLAGKMDVNLKLVDAAELFLARLEGVSDPEQKRRTIGNTFIDVFDEEAKPLNADFLLQGTLYPDVIESVSHRGPSATIKTHHNVGGLPEKMQLKLIEPLRYLFKDEVRRLGVVMGVPEASVYRHPFPGPGLAIRVLGELSEQRLDVLREADAIYIEELRAAGLYRAIGQAFAVLLPCKAVGVMGDRRTYEEVVALRAVETTDYMTADWYPIPFEVLKRMANRIVNEVRGVNRVAYDVTSKPPATIEWE